MYRARTLLESPDSCTDLLSTLRGQHAPPVDLPIQSLLPQGGIGSDQAIEFHGLGGSGKTHILYMLAIEAVLAGGAVVVFDTDYHWDSGRLLHLLIHRLPEHKDGQEGQDYSRENVATDLLDLIYVYQPQSLTGFLEDTAQLRELCMRDLQNHSVRYVLVDSFSAFHWQSLATKKPSTLDVFNALRTVTAQVSALLVYTTWDLGFGYMSFPHTVRLQVSKKYVLQFTQGLAQAMETKGHRMDVVNRGICYISSETHARRETFTITADACGFGQSR